MEGLLELVAASFARHGIECPVAPDSQSAWGRAPSLPAEHRSASPSGDSNSESVAAQTAHPDERSALSEHNFLRSTRPDSTP
jgi:hypothetical protein